MTPRLLPALLLVLLFSRSSPALELSGTLVSSNGAPPPDKLVVLVEHFGNRDADQPDAFAVRQAPGQDGKFTVKLPDNKTYTLCVTDNAGRYYAGYGHLARSTNLGGIVLQANGTLSGTVQNREHKPLPKLEIVLEMRLRPYTCFHAVDALRLRTDTKGAFSVENLAPGEYRYRPVSDDYAAQGATVEVSEDPAFLNLVLEPAARLKGKITDPQGKPVPGISVRVNRQAAKSDAQGQYRLGGISAGTNYISVSGPGYVPAEQKSRAENQAVLKAGQETTRDFQVMPAAVLRLTLEPADPTASLPEALEISLQPRQNERDYYRGDSGEAPLKERVAVFSNLAPGEYTLTLRNEDLPNVATNVNLVSGRETGQMLQLPKYFTYKGRVIDPAGKPVAEARIFLQATVKPKSGDKDGEDDDEDEMLSEVRPMPEMRSGRSRSGASDPDGKFEMKGLEAGSYRISIRQEDWMPTNSTLEITGNLDATAQPWVMQPGLKIAGLVIEAGGKPAAGYAVNLMSAFNRQVGPDLSQEPMHKNAEVNTNGAFEIKGLPPGKYNLTVHDADREEITALENVEAGSDDTIITIAKLRLLQGTVQGPDGKPVPGAVIHGAKTSKLGSSRYSSPLAFRQPVTTDAAGRFELALRAGNVYEISASAPRLLPQKTATVDLSGGAAASAAAPLQLTLARGNQIKGTVVGADGKPTAKPMTIHFSASGRSFMPRPSAEDEPPVETDAQGKFTLEGVPPGVITLSVYPKTDEDSERPWDRQILASKEVMVETNRPTEVTIALPKSGSIKGRFLFAKEEKPGEIQVMLTPADERGGLFFGEGPLRFHTQADEAGSFGFSNIPAGKYMVMAFGSGRGRGQPPTREMVEVLADQTVEITLGQKAPTAAAPAVAGRVTKQNVPFQSGEIMFMPVPKATSSPMELMMMGRQMTREKIGSNGVFSVKSLAPGEYVCLVVPRERGKPRDPEELALPTTYQTTLTLAAGQTNLDIDFSGGTLTGKITNPEGKPASRAFISVLPAKSGEGITSALMMMGGHRALSDKQGQYRIECLPAGVYNIAVRHEELGMTQKKMVELNAGSNQVDIVLAGGVTLTGTVTTTAGNAADGAMVMLMGDDIMSSGMGRVDEQGAFKLDPAIAPGTYNLVVIKPGYALEMRPITVTTNAQFNAVLAPGGDVRITVRSQGKPVSGKTVKLRAADGAAVPRLSPDAAKHFSMLGSIGLTIAPTDEQGQTTIRALKPGKYTVTVEGVKASAAVEIKPLETVEVTLDIP